MAFSYSSNLVFTNPQFIDNSQYIGATGVGIRALLDASYPEAAHDSSARAPPPQCFPGTREQHIEDITHWALDRMDNDPPPMLWLKGPAGVGKSALAQTCAEKLEEKLGAAFFFSLSNKWDDPRRFFTSIAYQLSTNFTEYRTILDNKIRDDMTLVTKSMARQFLKLIVQPLHELRQKGIGLTECIIIVDGLDECNDPSAQCEIIEIIAKSLRERSTPFRWAFFSRPEPHIEATFSKDYITTLCRRTALPISREIDGEIEIYLRDGFQGILRRHNLHFLAPWPSDTDIQMLVNASAGLFIYAATVLRSVGKSDSLGPEDQLQAILTAISDGHCRATSVNPFAELDAFYMLIMKSIPATLLPSVQLLSWMVLVYRNHTPWCAQRLSNVLGLTELNFRITCNRLHAVLWLQERPRNPGCIIDPSIDQTKPFKQKSTLLDNRNMYESIYGVDGVVSFYHKSFLDFLNDPSRSDKFCINKDLLANAAFKQCLRTLHKFLNSYTYDPGSRALRLAPGISSSAAILTWPSKTEYINSFLISEIHREIAQTMLKLHCLFDLDLELLQELVDLDYCKMQHLHQLYLEGPAGYASGQWQIFSVNGTILKKPPQNLLRRYEGPASSSQSLIWTHIHDVRYVIGHGSKEVYICQNKRGIAYFVPSRPIEEW